MGNEDPAEPAPAGLPLSDDPPRKSLLEFVGIWRDLPPEEVVAFERVMAEQRDFTRRRDEERLRWIIDEFEEMPSPSGEE